MNATQYLLAAAVGTGCGILSVFLGSAAIRRDERNKVRREKKVREMFHGKRP